MNEQIILKSGKSIRDKEFNKNLEYEPCAICHHIHVEMSEFLIGFFLEGTNQPVCLECAKRHHPVLFHLWEMGIFTEVPRQFKKSRVKFQKSYKRLRRENRE